ncbi:cytochrome P450 2C20-like [Dermacentor variabilis]|uniref:cytochrome P450 2C20-like n=1 Tax=Dermacentor variabilis TaxID=34621 RepID=UPI003F5CA858
MIVAVILIFCVFSMSLWLIAKSMRRCCIPPGTRLPPMPPARSIRGHVELNSKDFHYTKAIEWSKAYGPVFRCRLDYKEVVILNDTESIRKFINKNEVLQRSDSILNGRGYYSGIGSQNGDVWKMNKTFCMTMLHDLGFAKTQMEDHMMMRFRRLAKDLGETLGESLSVRRLVMKCAVGNVAHFFFPSGLPDEDAVQERLIEHLEIFGAKMLTAPLFESTPQWLRNLLKRVPFTRVGKACQLVDSYASFIREQIERYKPPSTENTRRDFIAQYTQKIEEAKCEPNPTFQYRYLVGNVKDILVAGTLSTTSTMCWLFVNFAVNEDTIQARVQQEIDKVVGQHREATWEDRKRMPYTQACLWEVGRWKTGTPLAVPREASDDIVEDDIFIPKGTVIIFNIWAAHNDPTYWNEPRRFDPGRFLKEEGSILQEKPRHLMTFSVGRRSCPGNTFASMELFLLMTFVLQKYHIALEEPLQQDINDPGLTLHDLKHLKFRFLPRH